MKNQHARLPCRRPQRGAVAIMFGLMLVMLIGFAGLAIDLGRFFVIKSELQNAVDACALSAASQLRPGGHDTNALTRAVAYGNVFSHDSPSNTIVKNRVNFQSTELDPAKMKITFATTNAGPYDGGDVNTVKFVKCNYPLDGLPIYFMRVLNLIGLGPFNTQTVSAMAVATRDAPLASCIPIAVCTNDDGSINYTPGEWITAASIKYGRGFFGWVDFDPPNGNEAVEILKGSRQCDISRVGDLIGAEPGNMANLDEAWNSRFGWYKSHWDETTVPPDKTGFAYSDAPADASAHPPLPAGNWWPWGRNAYSGTSTFTLPNFQDARARYLPYQTGQPPGIEKAPGANTFRPIDSTAHQTYGRADRRIVAAPVVTCSPSWTDPGSPGNAKVPILNWACLLMLNPYINAGPPGPQPYQLPKVEFLGLASDATSPCSGGEELAISPVLTQ